MKFKRSTVAISLGCALTLPALAQQSELAVTKAKSEETLTTTVETVLDAQTLSKRSITNIEDTARYIPGVQTNDTGNRFGNDGFNIRGLEGDAVAVTVDGVGQGETLNPSSFAAYGMYGSSRGEIELEHVKAVNITKGPSAVAQGPGSLAGSVTYVTNEASDFLPATGDATGVRLKTGFDARSDEWLVHGTVANRTGNFDSLLQYTMRDSSETEAHSHGENISGSARGQADPMDNQVDAVLLKLAYNFSEHQQLGFVYEKTDRETNGVPLSRQSDSYFDFTSADENNRERIGLFFNNENLGLAFADSIDVTLNYQELFSSGVTSFLYGSADGDAILRTEDRNFSQDSLSFNVDLAKSITGEFNHEIIYGFSFQQVDAEAVMFDRRFAGQTADSPILDGYPIRDQSFVPETEKTLITAYLADTVELSEQLSVNLGLRYDSTEYTPTVDSTFSDPTGLSITDSEFSAVVGEIGATYEFVKGHSINARIAQGYQAPTLQSLYFGTNSGDEVTDIITGNTFIDLDRIANSELDAQESTNFELTYIGDFENGNVSVSVFRTEYTNMIQDETYSTPYGTEVTTVQCGRFGCETVVNTDDVFTQPQNTGELTVDGFEVTANYHFTDNVSGRFAYTALDGTYDTASAFNNVGDDLETVSPDTATVGLGYVSDEGDWGAELVAILSKGVEESTQLSYTSLNNGAGPSHTPAGYAVFDLLAYYDVTENLRLTTAIYNLADKEYYRWEVLNSVRDGTGGFFGGVSGNGYQRYSEPGRSISAYVTYQF